MHLYFAGLARNCAGSVRQNIHSILSAVREVNPSVFHFYICENDSTDNTREEILSIASTCLGVHPVFLDGIVDAVPNPIQRIAYCRNILLNKIISQSFSEQNALYVPIDLDSCIASSLDPLQFKAALTLVRDRHWNAVFPFSQPYYYDIFALRADCWCDGDVSVRLRSKLLKGQTATLFAHFWHVSRKQYPFRGGLTTPIVVDSAFGGLGIYRVDAIQCLHYFDGYSDAPHICEHVNFNLGISRKCILPWFILDAPHEHIRLKIIGPIALFKRFISAIWSDINAFFS